MFSLTRKLVKSLSIFKEVFLALQLFEEKNLDQNLEVQNTIDAIRKDTKTVDRN